MGLEEHFVHEAVVADNVGFRGRQVQPPIAKILVHDIDGVVFKGGIKACAFKYFAQGPDCVDEVREGGEVRKSREEGRIVVVLQGRRVGYVLCFVNMLIHDIQY
jgi:hypothetical protein